MTPDKQEVKFSGMIMYGGYSEDDTIDQVLRYAREGILLDLRLKFSWRKFRWVFASTAKSFMVMVPYGSDKIIEVEI